MLSLIHINKNILYLVLRHTLSHSQYTFVKKDRFMESITKRKWVSEVLGTCTNNQKIVSLKIHFLESIKSELNTFSQYFKTSDNQTFLLQWFLL
jgi:hypothetical protein